MITRRGGPQKEAEPSGPDLPLADMHCHILPGVDDGPVSMDESLAMLELEYQDGVRVVFLTPHYREGMFETSREECRVQFAALKHQCSILFPDLALFPGCEFHACLDMPQMAAREPFYRMAGGDSVLIEFSASDEKFSIRSHIQRLIMEGFHPVIAHVERYPACRDIHFLTELKEMGALIQVNADAILGADGLGFLLFARRLLREGLVDMIGSDSHNTRDRAPHLGRCADLLSEKYGPEVTRYLLWESPRRMLPFSNDEGV